jgi:hypothetical protein
MPPNLFRDGKHRIGRASHEPIGNVMFAGPQNTHVSAGPNQLCLRHCLGNQSCPEIGTFKESVDDLDLFLFEKSSKFESGSKRSQAIGVLQG